MGVHFYLRIIFRELSNQKRFCILFVINLSIGLMGFISLDTFKVSLQNALAQNAKSFLSADMSLSARRVITAQELELARAELGSEVQESKLWEFFSMLSSADKKTNRLVQVKAIDSQYPFYGEMRLGSGARVAYGQTKSLQRAMLVWVYPEILTQLHLKIGDEIFLGDAKYIIDDTIVDDSTQTFRMASLAPKIYEIGRAHV